jgi:DNA invertase Pin-like site-specific DNA recombinase
MDNAALYLRSSKDRHDVSLDAQRRELMALAKLRNLTIVETFQDAVESGKDDQRPGFQALLRSMKGRERTWNHLLALDTSRIARNQYLAHALHFECEKRCIKVVYAKVPETNTVMDVVIRAVMQSFDELHSLMSREKGLAGMTENVRQGWRAGGRAPIGYRLEHIATGAMRDGAAVTKSRLVASPDAHKVRDYMKARAAGISRSQAGRDRGFKDTSDSTRIGMEWNALTYAGHTVWNVHNERLPGGGYKGEAKRRPRAEWVIQYDTHEALITTEEAEAILAALANGRAKTYRTKANYLLSGLLVTPDGKAWHGDGDGSYRVGKGKRISQASIENAVVGKLQADLVSDVFVGELLKEARRMSAPPPDDRLKPLRAQVTAISVKIGKMADLASEAERPRPFLEKIDELERQREKITVELCDLEEQQQAAEVFRAISEKDVRNLLASLAEHLQVIDREALKELIRGMVERIELCPTTLTARLHIKIATGELLATPRQSESISGVFAWKRVSLKGA